VIEVIEVTEVIERWLSPIGLGQTSIWEVMYVSSVLFFERRFTIGDGRIV
jgi:hypothetical protein